MKKIYALASSLLLAGTLSAQNDTLIWEDFNGSDTWNEVSADYEVITTHDNDIVWDLSPGLAGDEKWYLIDLDGLTPNNDQQDGAWFLTIPFGQQDEGPYEAVLAASSWFNPLGQANNWVVTKSFYCSADAELSWYSSPFQTPLYLDGYKVLLSTTTNDPTAFTETLFVAKEYVSIPTHTDSCTFANYTFAPATGFTHGLDGTDVFDNPTDCQRDTGALRKQTVNLSAYGGQRIFLAFVHDSNDDNLICLDNILVKGTKVDDAKIEESVNVSFTAYPNPTTDLVNIGYRVNTASKVNLKVIDNTGRVLQLHNLGTQSGNNSTTVSLDGLSAGIYTVVLETGDYRAVKQVVKK